MAKITSDSAVVSRASNECVDATRAGKILKKVGSALAKPGISRESVFRGRAIYAYSLDPTDSTLIVREDSARHKVIGKVVGGRFRALASKK